VARYLGVRPGTVYEYVRRGEISYRRIGSRLIRFTWHDVRDFVGEERKETRAWDASERW
jgi:excisionase family DNA binding protein